MQQSLTDTALATDNDLTMSLGVVPASLQPYFDKGILAFTQGHYAYAIDLLSFVVKQIPDATEARRYLRLAIQEQFKQHPPSMGWQVATTAATLLLGLIARLFELQGRILQAAHLYEWLLTLTPRSRLLLMQLANSLSLAGLDDAAIQTYEELLAIDSNHIGALRKLSRLAMKRGDDPKARRCFERILQLHPGDVEAQQSLRNLDALGTIRKGFSA